MRLVDLTLPVQEEHGIGGRLPPEVFRGYYGKKTVLPEERIHKHKYVDYTSLVYRFDHLSIVGTYLDFPGHIIKTDDGTDAANYPLEKLYRIDASVIHLDRADGSGGIHADELAKACTAPISGGALILNALGRRRFDEIEKRSVFLEKDAVQWIVDTGIYLIVSDVYEPWEVVGIFLELFRNGISTVCCPVNLDQLTTPRVKLTVLTAPFPKVTQLPCRVVAELE